MAIKTLNTRTVYSVNNGNFSLFTEYIGNPEELSVIGFICNSNLIGNGVAFKQGEEGYVFNYPDLKFALNSRGELVITSNDDKNFSIDDYGNLVMTEP